LREIVDTYGTVNAHTESRPAIMTSNPPAFTARYGKPWATANFNAGDIILFGMYTLHGSLPNTSNRYRLSSDTRYQLASEPIRRPAYGGLPEKAQRP